LFGIKRQSWYFHKNRQEKTAFQHELLIKLVSEKRKIMPRIGVKKLLFLLEKDIKLHGIKIGRDKFFSFMRKNNLLISKKRKYTKTTNSFHRFYKYSNLIKDFTPKASNQLYVSDITYIRLEGSFAYLSIITDAYSRKIVGHKLHKNLSRDGCIYALQKVLVGLPENVNNIIHHSDRGVQYCSDEYVKILEGNHLNISMTENGDPRENAIAERVNGILKDEFNLDKTFSNFREAELHVNLSIETYNNERPHLSLNNLTPVQVHDVQKGELKKLWKNSYKYANDQHQVSTCNCLTKAMTKK
jgi:transposase InsO family protein